VRSSRATYAIELHPEHLETVLDQFPTFTRILCQQFTARLKEANDELKQISAANALRAEQLLVDEGEVIIRQGDRADKLYSLVFGALRWEQDGQTIGGNLIQEFIEPSAYFSDGSYPVTVRATSHSCLAVIDKSSKEAVVRNYPQLVLELLSQS
jgi:CRP-like cAMP-binding protein